MVWSFKAVSYTHLDVYKRQLRANIDYGLAEARTTYGVIGVKVWIFKGEVFGFDRPGEAKTDKPADRRE